MAKTSSQYEFFKNVCLDENGLLCGIQEVIDGLQNITNVVSGNTTAIDNININVEKIEGEMVQVNSNIEELNGIVGEIQTCVCEPTPPSPTPTPTPTPCPTPTKKKCCCKPRVCRPTRCVQQTKQWGGWTIVVSRKYPDKYYKKSYKEKPKPKPRTLPLLQIPYGFENVDGTWTDKVPRQYIDSKGKIVNVKGQFVGMANKSQAYKKKPGATYVSWKPIR